MSTAKHMSKQLPRKALIAVSGFNGAIYSDRHKTGVFFVEALHPYEVLTAAGFEVDLASETGTFGCDDVSLTPLFVRKRSRGAEQPQASVHGQDHVSAEEGVRFEERRLRLLLRFCRPRCSV